MLDYVVFYSTLADYACGRVSEDPLFQFCFVLEGGSGNATFSTLMFIQ